ncbi:hypothetical protein [Pseudocnuella soli]|uniref:hypothetical protein n=1 Tax=Pseudocnuella soli TaxID=2502779 RepID=UPI001052B1AB|nr:hypothetical protein [Pseudocnuella soli]
MNQPLLYLFVFLSLLCHCRAEAQKLVADTVHLPGANLFLKKYNTIFGANLGVYRGHQYQDYDFQFSVGHPYFQSDKWIKGQVTYDGSTYAEVPMLYNLATDNLVVYNDSTLQKIQLVKEQVDSFSIEGHRFVHICADKLQAVGLRCGFYDVVALGKISLLVKRVRSLQQLIADNKVQVHVSAKDQFYLGKDGAYTIVNSKASLLNLLSDHKKEVQRFLKSKKLRYRAHPEATLLQAVTFYNQLNG